MSELCIAKPQSDFMCYFSWLHRWKERSRGTRGEFREFTNFVVFQNVKCETLFFVSGEPQEALERKKKNRQLEMIRERLFSNQQDIDYMKKIVDIPCHRPKKTTENDAKLQKLKSKQKILQNIEKLTSEYFQLKHCLMGDLKRFASSKNLAEKTRSCSPYVEIAVWLKEAPGRIENFESELEKVEQELDDSKCAYDF